ncbi:MAG TPA: transglutaminase N-terminal domain-containing protein, partial [Galbitalea sp.]
MNRLRIKHMTGFHYKGDVTASYNEARMLPASMDGQLVLFSN